MKYLKTYEGLFDFFKRKKESSFDVIGTSHDIMLDFVDEEKVKLIKQGKDILQYQILSKSSSKWREEIDETNKLIEPILKEWGIKHYYFHHVYLYIITDDFYDEIYKIFKGLKRRKLVDNTYQYLMVKNLKYYIYVNGEEMNIATNITDYLCEKYGIGTHNVYISALYDIISEVIRPIYNLDYMKCSSMNDHFILAKNGVWYYQPEFK